MIITLRGSVRSLWGPLLVLIGLLFLSFGVAMVVMPRSPGETQPSYVASIVIGLLTSAVALALTWTAARAGVIRDGQCLRVRQILAKERMYCPDDISGFAVDETEHDTLPLLVLQPLMVLADGSEVAITVLADYSFFPWSRRRAHRAVARICEWTGRPLLS